jgi:TetR/AcrR family transcriptional repressor of nem operon
MPYPPEHKARTHAKIVQAASNLFRRDGYQATGLDALMAAAGLTRGGFYAHFRDKAHLLLEALDAAFVQSRENLFARGHEALTGRDWERAASRRYLSQEHRRSSGDGCALPALGAEVARAPKKVQASFRARLEELLNGMAHRLGGGAKGRQAAIRLLSGWVGALLLSRAVGDSALGDEILAAARGEGASSRPRARRKQKPRAP